MSPATACARTLVDELARQGVREAVLAPGSRSAPLAFALGDADRQGRVRLHVRIDERTAGFLALGLAKSSRRPVAVVTTSGTASANLHPAVLEASHAGVPLMVITADRPSHTRGTGANQATDQVGLYRGAVRFAADLEPPGRSEQAAYWRGVASRAIVAARGRRDADPGPVHLNVPFDEPLVPADDGDEQPAGRPDGLPWTEVSSAKPDPTPVVLPAGPRTVAVAGDGAGPAARVVAERAGWPLLAEPSSGARTGTHALTAYRLLLAQPDLGDAIERVVVFGHPTLSRPVSRLLSRDDVDMVVVTPRPAWTDVAHRARLVTSMVEPEQPAPPHWLARWVAADRAAVEAVTEVLDAEPGLTGPEVAREVAAALRPGGTLFVGSSNPVRDLDLTAAPYPVGERRKVLANRGLSGIDGTVSTAVGAALARPGAAALALLGDLTFLHDATGLVIGRDEPRPDLTVVVANDDGGSVFATLEQGRPEHAASFERLFGTPLGADLGALCAASRTPHVVVTDVEKLRAELAAPSTGVHVVEARVDRSGRRQLESRLVTAARRAVQGALDE